MTPYNEQDLERFREQSRRMFVLEIYEIDRKASWQNGSLILTGHVERRGFNIETDPHGNGQVTGGYDNEDWGI